MEDQMDGWMDLNNLKNYDVLISYRSIFICIHFSCTVGNFQLIYSEKKSSFLFADYRCEDEEGEECAAEDGCTQQRKTSH